MWIERGQVAMSLDADNPRSSYSARSRGTSQSGAPSTGRAPRTQQADTQRASAAPRTGGSSRRAAAAGYEQVEQTQSYTRSPRAAEAPRPAARQTAAANGRSVNTSRSFNSNTGRTQRVADGVSSPARSAARAKAAARQQQDYVQNQWTSMKAPVAQSAENRAQNKRRSARGIKRFLPRAAAILFVAAVLSLSVSAYLGYWSFADVGNGIGSALGFDPEPEKEDPTPAKQPDDLVDTMGGLANKPAATTTPSDGEGDEGEEETPQATGETIEETGSIYPRSLTLSDVKSELHDSDGLWYVVGSFSYQFLKSGDAVENAVFTTTCPEAQLSTDRGEPGPQVTFTMEPAFGRIVVTALMPIGSYDNMTLLADTLAGYTMEGTIKLKNGNTIHRVLTFESGVDPEAPTQTNTGNTSQGTWGTDTYNNQGYSDALPQTDPNVTPSSQPQSAVQGF